MMKNKDRVNYFTTYRDKYGLQHYAVNSYNRVNGIVDRPTDNKEITNGMQAR